MSFQEDISQRKQSGMDQCLDMHPDFRANRPSGIWVGDHLIEEAPGHGVDTQFGQAEGSAASSLRICLEPILVEENADSHSASQSTMLSLTQTDIRQYVFLHSGAGTAELDGWRTSVAPGEILFIPSRTAAQLELEPGSRIFRFTIEDSFLISCVCPTLSVAFATYANEFNSPRKLRHWVEPHEECERDRLWCELMLARRRIGPVGEAAVAGYVLMMLFEKYNHLVPATGRQMVDEKVETPAHVQGADAATSIVVRFRGLVEQHLLSHWRVQDYARDMHIRPSDLIEACKQVMGDTPSEVIRDRLLLEAKRMLTYGSSSASQIAYHLGFNDAAYFSRFFKRETKMSPIEFRRIQASIVAAPDSWSETRAE